jgi:hypothetical protein
VAGLQCLARKGLGNATCADDSDVHFISPWSVAMDE